MNSAKEFQEFLNRLTENARLSLQHADGIARGFGSAYIGTEHILLGVLSQNGSIGAKLLETSGVTLDRARTALKLTPKALVINLAGGKGLSEAAKLTLRTSWEIAREFNQDYCGTEHILYSILIQKNARANVLLRDMNINVDDLTSELENYLNQQRFEYEEVATSKKPRNKKAQSALEFFGTDLTEEARAGRLDPVIGRAKELQRMVTILSRRTKNNPVLIGEPGVGKTAIVEGLAQRIAEEKAPENLLDKRIVMLDLAGMIAGTKYRGEFEERLKAIMQEIAADSNVIVFIDEIHLLVGAGAAEGALDAANILKPVLARGTMRVIGATTIDEYQKSIEKDAALERRFQSVQVLPPSVEETVEILRGLKTKYEAHHGVGIDDEIIEQTVRLSERYMTERFMPDKALDLLDETAAHIRVERSHVPETQRKLLKEIKLCRHRMEEAVIHENFEVAAKHKVKLAELQETLEKQRNKFRSRLIMTEQDLAGAVALITGIPARKILKKEASYLMNLEKTLAKHVIGQSEALQAVARAIRRNRSGVSARTRPIGSFVFLGPSGVGKTELARVLARELYDRNDALIKIDMSEFSERHTASRLVGAPAGYVGYEEGGQLTDKVRRNPYSLILLDEIEKAHPDIFNMLLQILEDGVLTDAKGRTVDFTNTVIIMTGNIGAEQLQRESSLGFRVSNENEQSDLDELHEDNKERVMEELKGVMRPELINRIDKVIIFRALTNKEALQVLNLQIEELNQRLQQEHGLGVRVSLQAKRALLKNGYKPQSGVRTLRRELQDEIEDQIAESVITGIDVGTVLFDAAVQKGKLIVTPVAGVKSK
ncbi:MAG: ATP-dependent Clp protease ATP-binding subunit [Candidatus Saccharimonadales bacterium]